MTDTDQIQKLVGRIGSLETRLKQGADTLDIRDEMDAVLELTAEILEGMEQTSDASEVRRSLETLEMLREMEFAVEGDAQENIDPDRRYRLLRRLLPVAWKIQHDLELGGRENHP